MDKVSSLASLISLKTTWSLQQIFLTLNFWMPRRAMPIHRSRKIWMLFRIYSALNQTVPQQIWATWVKETAGFSSEIRSESSAIKPEEMHLIREHMGLSHLPCRIHSQTYLECNPMSRPMIEKLDWSKRWKQQWTNLLFLQTISRIFKRLRRYRKNSNLQQHLAPNCNSSKILVKIMLSSLKCRARCVGHWQLKSCSKQRN